MIAPGRERGSGRVARQASPAIRSISGRRRCASRDNLSRHQFDNNVPGPFAQGERSERAFPGPGLAWIRVSKADRQVWREDLPFLGTGTGTGTEPVRVGARGSTLSFLFTIFCIKGTHESLCLKATEALAYLFIWQERTRRERGTIILSSVIIGRRRNAL